MLFTLLAVWCASGCALGAVPAREKPFYLESAHAQHFKEFKAKYHKVYATPEEEQHRFEIFKENLNEINMMNAKYEETVFAITKFSDLTTEEFTSRYTGLIIDERSKPSPPPLNLCVDAPEAFDWRNKTVVSRVKDQGACGSCWAFATIGSLESHYAIKHNKLIEFSAQQLVDCDTDALGCGGGNPYYTCRYLMSKGVVTESDYPYTARQGTCRYNSSKVVTRSSNCQDYAGSSEEDIKNLLYVNGPLVIGLDASRLNRYQGGVLTDCDTVRVNHAVLLVGYGVEKGVPFWTIKNSWATEFGEEGYLRIKRGVDCLGSTSALVIPVEV